MSNNWESDVLATIAAMGRAHYALLSANMALADSHYGKPGHASRVDLIDAAALLLSKGKWFYGVATGEVADHAPRSFLREDLALARESFADVVCLAQSSRAPGQGDAHRDMATARAVIARLSTNNSEIQYFDNVPVVPAICPVIVLVGSSHEMGVQYARQCIEIFGAFIFRGVAARTIDSEQRDILRQWESELARYTPEVLHMARGMAEGAASCGIPLTYEQAVAIWTDLRAPARQAEPIGVLDADGGGRMGAYFGALMTSAAGQIEQEELCSGCAAWGSATSNGQLHFAASTDHDCTFQVTIVAFPDSGHNFIYTPFSANGSIPGTGRFGFAGHPGMNSAGLAYVHHGGGGSCAEPKEAWGYGVPRGAATMHVLRYSDSATAALERMLEMPVGNAGRLLGSTGGFFADSRSGYVIEDLTPGRPVVRRGQVDRHGSLQPLLYATNNLQSPDAGFGFCPPARGYLHDMEAGWYPSSAADLADVTAGELTRRLWALSSESRNRYFHARLMHKAGQIDLDYLESIYRTGPEFGQESWVQTEARLAKGERLKGSVAHRLNAFVAAGTPASGCYKAGVGPIAHRSLTPNRPGHGYFYFQETSALWQIDFRDDAWLTVCATRETTCLRLDQARSDLEGVRAAVDALGPLKVWLAQAERAFSEAGVETDDALRKSPDAAARTLRLLTVAQVRAAQVSNAVAEMDCKHGPGASRGQSLQEKLA